MRNWEGAVHESDDISSTKVIHTLFVEMWLDAEQSDCYHNLAK
eukprot:CAMPEP_0196179998 /NCGR_PEP_ID=MMETSP0911-20130528/22747_1 /TAXON_ID=49265 /ORGANISM="Thalassiosira rotula, Strain GSO102" /LENGTH=42 /DNA_ID= /DNA_START= /DNA_END= /DNA_ORIENTATION=